MPPKASAKAGEKTYDEVTVLGLLLALKGAGGTYNKSLSDMSSLDGKRTTSSFEHSLRAVNKLAGELFEKQKNGAKLTPADIGRGEDGGADAAEGVTPAKKATPKATPRKRKGTVAKEDGEETPKPKKGRATPATRKVGKKVDSGAEDDDEDTVKAADVKEEAEASIFGCKYRLCYS